MTAIHIVFINIVLICNVNTINLASDDVEHIIATDTTAENQTENIPTIDENSLYAKSAILIDAESRRVLYSKNGYEQLPMASTTKIMTCLVALENSNPDDEVTFSSYAASMPKVKLGASNGNKFYMKDMLYSLMLESHNDTAVAIAESVAGSVEGFADMMNARAAEIGAVHTNFVTPNGLDAEGHYTTAYDLAVIAAEAIKNEQFVEIINTKSHTFTEIEGKGSYGVYNKDAFLGMMEGAFGIKTGFTGNAGYCFVGAARKNNKTLISVVLASGWPPDKTRKWKDTIKLMDYGFDNYDYKTLFEPVDSYKRIQVTDGVRESVDTYIDGKVGTLIAEYDKVEYIYNVDEVIEAPVTKNQQLGTVCILINDELYARFPIMARESVKKIDFRYCFMKTLKEFLTQ